MQKHDTSAELRALQAEIHRRMGGEGRLQLAMDMSRAMRDLAMGRIRTEHPGKTDRDVMRIYFQELLARSAVRSI